MSLNGRNIENKAQLAHKQQKERVCCTVQMACAEGANFSHTLENSEPNLSLHFTTFIALWSR